MISTYPVKCWENIRTTGRVRTWLVIVSLQLRTCTRAWVTVRSARCLKARIRSTWRSNSCTGSSPWSWTNNGDTFLSSLMRSRRRQRAPRRGRYTQTHKAAFPHLEGVRLWGSSLVSLRWTLPLSSSWVLFWPPSRRSSRTWMSWGEWRLWRLLMLLLTVVFASNVMVDPWYAKKTGEILQLNPPNDV